MPWPVRLWRVRVILVAHNACDCPLGDANLHIIGNSEADLVLLDRRNDSVKAPGGDDFLPDGERADETLRLVLPPSLRSDQQEPHQGQ